MRRFSHWIFDLDGTVINSSQHYELSITTILSENGIDPTTELIARAYYFFNPEEYFATVFSQERHAQLAVKRLIELNKFYADQIPAFDGIESLLVFLRSQDIEISVWTGRDVSSARQILENIGLRKYLSSCVGGTCVPKNKPAPDGLLKILNDSKRQGHEVVMIGDHQYDMLGARAAQVSGVSVSWDNKAHAGARELSDLHFTRIQDLHEWAQKLYAVF